MKTSLYILIILFSTSLIWSQNQNDILKIRKAERKAQFDSLRQVRSDFLNDTIFTNLKLQDTLFKVYEGLWNCVKIEENRYGTIKYAMNRDFLFSENMIWHLDYPCSMTGYKQDVLLRNDSMFFYSPIYESLDKRRIESRGDTLVIFGDMLMHYETRFYLKQKCDSNIISELKEKGFNPACINGNWNLELIADAESGTYRISETYLTHVPRVLNFESDVIRIEGRYLITSDRPNGRFEITEYSRYYDNEGGETQSLHVKELQKINGIVYHYLYEQKR